MVHAPVVPLAAARSAAGSLLVACARALLDRAQLDRVRECLVDPQLDWSILQKVAEEHGVLPLLHKAVQSADPDAVPPEAALRIRTTILQCTTRNLLLMQQLLKLLNLMHSQGLRAMPYKGPSLAMQAYGDLSLRPPGDLDILVPADDLAKARKILDEQGFHMAHTMDAKAEADYLASAQEYDIVYLRDSDKVCVELHWRMVGDFFSFNPDPAGLWDRAIQRTLAGTVLRTFSPEDMLLVLCAHGMKHFWTRLSWICDLAYFIQSTPAIDWNIMVARASELEARKMTLLGLLLAHDILDAAIPEPVLAEARASAQPLVDELVKRLFLETQTPDHDAPGADWQLTDGGLFRSLMFHVQTREKWSSGLKYFFHRAFTPNIVDESWIKLPRGLGFLRYLVRPIRLITKYGPLRFLSRRSA